MRTRTIKTTKGAGGCPQEEQDLSLISSVTTYGLWLVLNPGSLTLLNIKSQRLKVDEAAGTITISVAGGNSVRTLLISDEGKTWFKSRKRAIAYCNALNNNLH